MEGDSGDRGEVGQTQTSRSLRRRQSTAVDLSPIHKTAAAHGGKPVAKKVSDTARKPTPDLSTPTTTQPVTTTAATDVQQKELSDDEIVTAMDHMHAAYLHVDRLQHPGCGQYAVGKTLPRFHPVFLPHGCR